MTHVHPSAIVDPKASLGSGVEVGPYSVIGPNVAVGERTRVMAHVYLDGWTTIGRECTIFPFASIGTQTQDLKYAGGKTFVVIGDRTTIREYVTVNSGTAEGETTRVGSECHIMAYTHIAHACQVGNGVIIANCGTLAGQVIVEDQAILGGMVGVHQFVRIGRLAFIGGCSKITQDVPPFMIVDGNPPSVPGLNTVGLERKNLSPEARALLKQAHRILYRQGLSTAQALAKIRSDLSACPEIDYLVEFVAASERGIVK